MTKASMSLAELAEKGPDADCLREMIQFVAQRLMDLDVETRCGAAHVVGADQEDARGVCHCPRIKGLRSPPASAGVPP
jgi:hypothetical protein